MTPAVYHLIMSPNYDKSSDWTQIGYSCIKKTDPAGWNGVCLRLLGITNLRIHDFRHTASTNLRQAGVDTATAMKIVGHKSDHMPRRCDIIEAENLHNAAAKLRVFRASTLITRDLLAVGAEIVSA